MAAEKYNSIGGFSVNWPPVDVVDSTGNVVTNHNFPSGNVTTNTVYSNYYNYANGVPFSSAAAGTNEEIQYNNQGAFGADSSFTFDDINKIVKISNLIATSSAYLGDVDNVTIDGGVNGYVLQTNGAGVLTWTAQTGGGGGNGVPGGANTQVQFNNAGTFAGDSNFVFDIDTDLLTAAHIGGEGGNISNIAISNINGIGNIASINLDGDQYHFLNGLGVWATHSNIHSANFANYAGNVVDAAQPNITSVGTLTTLSVAGVINAGSIDLGTGNINAGNVDAINGLYTDSLLVSETSHFNGNVTYAATANITVDGPIDTGDSSNVTLGPISNIHISGGTASQVLSTDGAGTLDWYSIPETNPGGSNTEIQYNDNGVFGASPAMTFDNTTNNVIFTSEVVANSLTLGAGAFTFKTSEIYFATTVTTTETELYMVNASEVTAMDYTIIATDDVSGKRQTSKISSLYYDTEVNFNETSALFVGGLVGDFSVVYTPAAGPRDPKVVLLVSPATSNTTSYKIMIERYAS